MIVGFKLWYADGTTKAIGVSGRPRADVQADVGALPESGLQCVMVFSDEHSTVNCPHGHNTAFALTHRRDGESHRRCPQCGEKIQDVSVRYRRMVQGNDHYFIAYDETPPPKLRDWLIGQTDKPSDVDRYRSIPGAKIIAGGFVNDTAYKAYVEEAMADFDVTQFGLPTEPGTTDR